MPRHRLRPDFPRMTYAFACVLLEPIPQALWETAHAMQTLWNTLVAQHDALLTTFDAATTKADQRAAYDQFWREAYLVVRDEGERLGLSAWPKWHIYDTFRAAQQRFARHQGGVPHAHHGLRQVLLPHRTDSGGVPLAWLWQDAARKHTAILPRRGGHHHQEGYITVGYERVYFRVLLHRAIPPEAILKRIALSGRFEPALRAMPGETRAHPAHHAPNGWQWHLLLSVEVAPRPAEPPTGRSVGLDLGWRVRPHGLRVAVLWDGAHAWEWVVPWDMANRSLRRRQAYYGARSLPLDATASWRHLWALQSEIDDALDVCKTAIDAIDTQAWPPEALTLWQQRLRLRAAGLRRLHRLLTAAAVPCPVLATWTKAHALRTRRLRGAQLHLLKARQHLYRHFADWLARHCDTVGWEGDLDLKTMAEEPSAAPALEAARKYRQMAGLTTLRLYIREALAKRGRVLEDLPAQHTTRTCAQCGETVPPGPALVLTCLGGHATDQDLNAAMVLRQGLPPGSTAHHQVPPMPTVDREQLRRGVFRLDIPRAL